MKKISRICFITLVFMSATLPSYSGVELPSDGNISISCPNNKNCVAGYFLDTNCECMSCTAGFFCTGDNKKKPCPNGQTSPDGSKSEDECVYNCTQLPSNASKKQCKETGYCGYYSGPGYKTSYCKACNVLTDVEDCKNYAGCYWVPGNGCTHCPRGYYCKSVADNYAEELVACEEGQISQRASYSKDDCYFDCTLYNEYKTLENFGVTYAKDMCKAAPGCYWKYDEDYDEDEVKDEDEYICEDCPNGFYCDNTKNYGLEKQECPFNSTSDPKSRKKSDCYLGSSNIICDGNDVCYNLGDKEKVYYWQTNDEHIQSIQAELVQFPKPEGSCFPKDPLPCR